VLAAAASSEDPRAGFNRVIDVALGASLLGARLRTLAVYPLAVLGIALIVIVFQLATLLLPGRVLFQHHALYGLVTLGGLLEWFARPPAVGGAVLILAVAALLWGARAERFSGQRRALLQRLPRVGSLLRLGRLAGFYEVLGLALENDVSLPEGLRAAAAVCGDAGCTAAVDQALERIEGGEDVGVALAAVDLAPRHAAGLIATAMRRDAWPAVCAELGELYRSEYEEALPVVTRMIQVMLSLVAGIFVAFAALNLFLSMYQATGSAWLWGL
jgi:type II secretory pathway component PulF